MFLYIENPSLGGPVVAETDGKIMYSIYKIFRLFKVYLTYGKSMLNC